MLPAQAVFVAQLNSIPMKLLKDKLLYNGCNLPANRNIIELQLKNIVMSIVYTTFSKTSRIFG